MAGEFDVEAEAARTVLQLRGHEIQPTGDPKLTVIPDPALVLIAFARRARAAAFDGAAAVVQEEARREGDQGKATKARRLLTLAHQIRALAARERR